MSRIMEEPKFYKHEQLMRDLNELFIRIKFHLFDLGDEEAKRRHPKPTNEEINEIHNKVHDILSEDSKPMRRY